MNYYIQGSPARAEEIKAAFEKLWCDTTGWKFNVEGGFYYTHDGRIDLACGKFLINLIKTHPDYKELELPVEPKFKVGDKIQGKHTKMYVYTVLSVDLQNQRYLVEHNHKHQLFFTSQDNFELVQNPKPHYDIANFKPFHKVLVRDRNRDKWQCAWFSGYNKKLPYPFITTGTDYRQCIPFEGNEHLLGTTDMCDEQYINW